MGAKVQIIFFLENFSQKYFMKVFPKIFFYIRYLS